MRRGPMTPEELRRYAEMIVRGCVALRRGDTLLEMVSLGHRDLAVAISEAAYRRGAVAVDVAYDDNRVYAARIAHAPKAALGHETPWRSHRRRRCHPPARQPGVRCDVQPGRIPARNRQPRQVGTGLVDTPRQDPWLRLLHASCRSLRAGARCI